MRFGGFWGFGKLWFFFGLSVFLKFGSFGGLGGLGSLNFGFFLSIYMRKYNKNFYDFFGVYCLL